MKAAKKSTPAGLLRLAKIALSHLQSFSENFAILMRTLRSVESAEIFENPVLDSASYSEDLKETYRKSIARPMDYRTLCLSVENREYATLAMLLKDLFLIYHNCRTFNPNTGENQWIHNLGVKHGAAAFSLAQGIVEASLGQEPQAQSDFVSKYGVEWPTFSVEPKQTAELAKSCEPSKTLNSSPRLIPFPINPSYVGQLTASELETMAQADVLADGWGCLPHFIADTNATAFGTTWTNLKRIYKLDLEPLYKNSSQPLSDVCCAPDDFRARLADVLLEANDAL